MPFDEFFSSKQKDDFVTSPEGLALYHELKSMPVWERKRVMWQWKSRPMTQVEKEARRLVSRELNVKYSCRNRATAERGDKNREIAAARTKTTVYRGYETTGSVKGHNKHGLGTK
jgi:hypothetical protein